MRPTVDTGYWSEGYDNSDKELSLQLSQIRSAINKVFQRRRTVATGGTGVSTTLWTEEAGLGSDMHASLTVTSLATNVSGSAYGKFEKTAMFFRPSSSVAAQLGATQNRHPDIASAGVALTLGVTADGQLYVAGNDGGSALTWDLWIEVRAA